MNVGHRPSDVRALFDTLRQDADDIANSVDAGLPDASVAALGRLQAHLSEAERAASKNGSGTVAAAPAASGEPAAPPAAAVEAEEHVLGAMMLAKGAIKSVATELRPTDFYRDSHRLLYEAILTLDDKGSPVDVITLCDYLEQNALLDRIHGNSGGPEGKGRVVEIANIVPAASNAVHYARIVRRAALERRLQAAVVAQPRNPELISEAAAALAREQVAGDPRRALDAADWLDAQPEGVPAVWGNSDSVLWAEGEPLMIYGPDGVGKTSIAQQLVLHLCGIRRDVLLGLPVRRADRPVLYLACDRPRQARRSLYRMIPKEQHADLRGRLLIWEGPLPFSIPATPRALLDFCLLHEAGTIVIDSLKDVAVELTKPDTALKVNQAFQYLNANGVELAILHHPRKDPAGMPAKPKTLEDVYGDRNFVAGMGSVVSIWGKGGDPIVELHHLKQPAGEYGPVKVLHNHDEGVTVLYEHATLLDILSRLGTSTVPALAAAFYGNADPTKNELEKTRRQLRKLASDSLVIEMKDAVSGTLSFRAA